jgi:hypothetical protein
MDILTLALCKKIAAGAVSGISNLEIDNTTLKITTNDGQTLDMVFPTPEDGTSITDIKIDENNHLLCTMSNGLVIDAGELKYEGGDNRSDATTEDIDKLFN